MNKYIESFINKFKSGNSVAVSQAVIKREEYDAIKQKIDDMESALSDSNEMLYELVKVWKNKMPKSSSDVDDQIEHNQKLIDG
jgi:hypothetical protein